MASFIDQTFTVSYGDLKIVEETKMYSLNPSKLNLIEYVVYDGEEVMDTEIVVVTGKDHVALNVHLLRDQPEGAKLWYAVLLVFDKAEGE